jgi:hypothetical protein
MDRWTDPRQNAECRGQNEEKTFNFAFILRSAFCILPLNTWFAFCI